MITHNSSLLVVVVVVMLANTLKFDIIFLILTFDEAERS